MNLGLTTSFIIAGMLFLLIGFFHLRLGQHSADLTLHEMSKTHAEAVYEILLHDLHKVGYNMEPDMDDPDNSDCEWPDNFNNCKWEAPGIQIADSNRIAFKANLESSAVYIENLPTMVWELTNDEVPGSRNPNHRVLERIYSTNMVIDTPAQTVVTGAIDDEITRIGIGVTRFELRYFSGGSDTPLATPVPPASLENIRRIEVLVEVQPREGIAGPGGQTRFPVTQWRKTIVPRNLNLD